MAPAAPPLPAKPCLAAVALATQVVCLVEGIHRRGRAARPDGFDAESCSTGVLAGPPGDHVELWPDGGMPGKHWGRMQAERFMCAKDAPPSHQKLRYTCSPLHVGTRGHYSMFVNKPTLTPFIAEGSRTAVVVMPGGGGVHIAWDVEGTAIARNFVQMGISAFILKYRVPKSDWNKLASLMDAQRAVSMVRTKYGFPVVGVFGGSYGGLKMTEASTAPGRMYKPVDENDAGSPRPDFALLMYPGTGEFSEEHADSAPPTFIGVSEDDPCTGVGDARDYFRLLRRGGSDAHELHVYPGGMHGYGNCEYYPFLVGANCDWPQAALGFLARNGLAP